ncbi:MAG: hypothetical protein KKF48_00165 [Nanoarchaeota archaeon]|nr:hypothetical protein [Nanoarchaeota archaeon]MBU1027438.1 hypothetical protein [Nanoarchaeota archaeon]
MENNLKRTVGFDSEPIQKEEIDPTRYLNLRVALLHKKWGSIDCIVKGVSNHNVLVNLDPRVYGTDELLVDRNGIETMYPKKIIL